jgi:transcriptional regulator with XRE-family HTH domain
MPNEAWESVAAHLIRMARERAAISQGELSRRSGIAQALISRYESGKVQPTLPTLKRLIEGAGGVLTLELDGRRLIDTRRMPTEEEAQGIERAFVRMLEEQPSKIRRQHDAARRRWGKTLREFADTGRAAFPRYSGGS